MNYNLFLVEDISTIGNSLLFPSGTEIGSVSCIGLGYKSYWVSLQACGNVHLIYKGEHYREVCDYSDELVKIIKNDKINDAIDNGDLEIVENNWWEFCFSDGNGELLDYEPKRYKICDIASDLIYYINMLMKNDTSQE